MSGIFRRIVWIVLDSVGIGEMPDADEYGDVGSDTLGHLAARRKLNLPTLSSLGIANIRRFDGLVPTARPIGCYGRCALASPGKDTTTGHWEMAGIVLKRPFPIYPGGFPDELMQSFEQRIGRRTLGNRPASGTEIIKELGAEHLRTAMPIVYTSADSVFQVAAHEEVIPVPELYRMCETARSILRGRHEVGRVIARPFVGTPGVFTRTANRKDFAVPPPQGMLLDRLADQRIPVVAVGKISEIFLGRGVTTSKKTKSNADGMEQTVRLMDKEPDGLIWLNLVDFDMLYGHRNDAEGYSRALEQVDDWLPEVLAKLTPTDLLVITADHGCDPTTASTDHSREFVPLLVYGDGIKKAISLGTRGSLADIGQTVAENFETNIPNGTSFLETLIN